MTRGSVPVPPRDEGGRYVVPDAPRFFWFDADAIAAWQVPDGARVLVRAEEGWCGFIRKEEQVIDVLPEGQTNGCSGPIAIEGAEPGDTLRVSIHSVDVRGDRGITALMPGWGLLGDQLRTGRTRFSVVSGKEIRYGSVVLPYRPMIGTIGVAPAQGRVLTLTPGPYLGNVDLVDITAGSTLYLPVGVRGAMFGLGDGKALGGEGEIAAAGVEMPIEVELEFTVLRGRGLPVPIVATADRWIAVGSAPDLLQAARLAAAGMVELVAETLKLDWTDSYAVVGLLGSLRIGQLANPWVTVGLHLQRHVLGDDWLQTRFSVLGG
jgi:amidase